MNKIKLGSKSSLYPYPATIISTEIDGVKNFMQLGFVGIVNANPGMVAMGIGRHHHTVKALKKDAVFALAIASANMMLKADYVGIRPGDKYDKSTVFETEKGDYGANLIKEAPINLEVKILEILDLGGLDYTVIAEILEVYADENIMTGKNPDIEKINPIMLSMYENKYFTVGKHIGYAWKDGLEYEKLESFVKETIFPAFDELRENAYFKPFIDDTSKFVFDEKTYVGYTEFSQWLDSMRHILETEGLTHKVFDFNAAKINTDTYKVSFRVVTTGKMKSGNAFDVKATEEWILCKQENGYLIQSYLTK